MQFLNFQLHNFSISLLIGVTVVSTVLARPQNRPSGDSLPDLEQRAASAQARGNYEDAEKLHRQILSLRWAGSAGSPRVDPAQILDDFAAVLSFGYFRGPQLESALKKFKQEIAIAPLNKDAYVPLRDGLLSVTLGAEAESLMLGAVDAFPDSRQIRYHLAEFYASSEKHQRAIQVFQQAIPLKGASDDDDRVQRSLVYRRIGDMNTEVFHLDDAAAAYQTSLELNPDSTEARLGLADLYLRRDRVQDAVAHYSKVAQAQPRNAAAHHGLAQGYLQLGRFTESAAEAAAALQADPSHLQSRYVQGIALIRDGRNEPGRSILEDYQRREAAAESEKRRRLDIEAVDRTASAAMMAGRGDEAIRLFRDAIRAHPGSAIFYLKLGLAQSQLGRHRDAVETFQSMIERGMDDFLVYRSLAREYELLGDVKSSLRERVRYLQKYDAALKARL